MSSEDELRKLHESNRQGWNEGAQAYEDDLEERIEFLQAGGQNFCPPELAYLADLDKWCSLAIHLQCAGGTDTLSLWNRGAKEVIGIDISDRMIAVAQAKSDAIGANATWIRSDIFDAPSEFDSTADLVYSGRGAVCWIMDLDRWASVIHRLLKPGGKFYLFEGHPVSDLWTMEDSTYQLDPDYGDYFQEKTIESVGWPTTYIGDLGKPEEEHAMKYERVWRTDQIVNAVIGAGLRLLKIEEHPDLFWDRFPKMDADLVRRTPQTLSLLAERPAN
ncbi:MAG: class I SAM-dependent methyltransferase [Chlorobia bacterium]|nr:class I SAM-dependent methyltransferase [Fimbriimonadaceae bacterium]